MTDYMEHYRTGVPPLEIPQAEVVLACMLMFNDDGFIHDCDDEEDLVAYVIMRETEE